MQEPDWPAKRIRAAQGLFYLNSAIWLFLCAASLLRGGGPEHTILAWIVAVLMVGNAGAMLSAGLGIGTGRRGWYSWALVVLVVNIVLTVTDQFGVYDLVTLILDLALLGLLIHIWRRRPAGGAAPGS